jgi:hypothetical protein
MVQEMVRSEIPSLKSLDEVLGAIKKTEDTDELATLLLMLTELYGDASCTCEQLEGTYGMNSQETMACNLGIKASRDEVLSTFRDLISRIRRK